jgi:hypothetical protein
MGRECYCSAINARKGERYPMAKEIDLTTFGQETLPGLAVSDEGTDPEDFGSISSPFDPEKIKVKTESRTLDLVVKRISYGEIDLTPEFQRRARLWDSEKKSRLIESLLLRIPLPVFYVSADAKENWAVVDGLQRLTTISDFVGNEFSLINLEYLDDLNGQKFEQLPRPLQRRIEETLIVIHIIEPGTPDDVMINIFKRINTGGAPLNAQEIRNALVKGPVRPFLRELVARDSFLEATERTVNDTRLGAQECAARFCAFFIQPYQTYESDADLDSFILKAMRKISALSDQERHALGHDFKRAMVAAKYILGRHAFRKFSDVGGARGPVNKALFEATAVNLARLSDEGIERLVVQRDAVLEAMRDLIAEEGFFAAISSSTGDHLKVKKRFGALETMLTDMAR